MAEEYTAWLWRARSVIGKKGLYTTRHRMDEEGAAAFFAKEGITEYFKLENSGVQRFRNLTQEEIQANSLRVTRQIDPDYVAPLPGARWKQCLKESGS